MTTKPSTTQISQDEHAIPVPPVEGETDATYPIGRGSEPDEGPGVDPLEHVKPKESAPEPAPTKAPAKGP